MAIDLRLTGTVPALTTPSAILDDARSALTAAGFRVLPADPTAGDTLVAVGPSLSSTRQDPLLGAGTLRLTITPPEVALVADLRGTWGLTLFARMFPVLLLLGLYAWWKSGAPMSKPLQSDEDVLRMLVLLIPVGVASSWWIRWRTRDALQRFLHRLLNKGQG
jgi:hypothetical protein